MQIIITDLEGKKLEFESKRVQVTNVRDYSGNPSEEIERCEIKIVNCTCSYNDAVDFIGEIYRAKEGFTLEMIREHDPNSSVLIENIKPSGYVQSSDDSLGVIAFEKAVFSNHVSVNFN